MKKRIMSCLSVYAFVLLAMIAFVVVGCAAPAATPPPAPTSTMDYTVKIMSKAGIGDYLVDAKGMTLYYFTKDTLGTSNATSAILQIWPIFNVANLVLPSSLNAADFGTITTDGQQQATYKGWPLYYYAKDIASGDTLGQGVNDVWFVANPQAPMATSASERGRVLQQQGR
jgi:predicted lipoprotein with Yx(FWY)xxD motif